MAIKMIVLLPGEGDHPGVGVRLHDPGWYHYDETWGYVHGPFATPEAAEEACRRYAESL
jgi:hypothetical protein